VGLYVVWNVCRLDRSSTEFSNSSLSGNLGRCIESGSVVEVKLCLRGLLTMKRVCSHSFCSVRADKFHCIGPLRLRLRVEDIPTSSTPGLLTSWLIVIQLRQPVIRIRHPQPPSLLLHAVVMGWSQVILVRSS
jgi:hypothetical protein